VAENDENLESYFVPTIVLDDFLADRYDLIRGAKGSGKSAILRMVSKNPGSYPQLKDVQLTVATEHTGEPAFKRAFNGLDPDVPDEKLVSAWKSYLLNMAFDAIEDLPKTTEGTRAVAAAEACAVRYRNTSLYEK